MKTKKLLVAAMVAGTIMSSLALPLPEVQAASQGPDVNLTTSVNGNISQRYEISPANGQSVDLSKVVLRYYYEKSDAKSQSFYCDNAGLNLSVAPYYTDLAKDVSGSFKSNYLEISFAGNTTISNGKLNLGVRFNNSDWSAYSDFKEKKFEVIYDGSVIKTDVYDDSASETPAPTPQPEIKPEPTPTPAPTPEPEPTPQPTPSTGIVKPSQVSINTATPSNITAMNNSSSYGESKKAYYYSKYTNSYRAYNIYLPKNYSANKQYPVIYMLHGIGGNEDAFGTSPYGNTLMRMAGNMMASGDAAECIIVFPNIRVSTTRETSIFSAQNYKYYDAFREELIDCLMPHIESTYSVKTGRENTAVAGFSMGGRESLYIGVSRADKFGYVAAFCPAPGCLPNYMNGVYESGLFATNGFKVADAYKDNTLVMIVKGQNDSVVGDQPLLYHNTLTTNGQAHVYYDMPGGHEERVYGNGFYNLLRYAFK